MPIKFQVEIAREVKRDVEEIWNFIAEDSPNEASKFILALEDQLLTLEQFPNRCALIPENDLLGTQVRHLIHGNYRTLFRVSEKTVHVLRIIHAPRLLDTSLLED